MASMVEEIMDVVHLQMGQRLALQLAPVDLGALVEGMARTLEASAGHRATLDVDAPHDLVVEGDRARLERVVQNLLGNAVKYSPEATAVRLTVRPQEEGVAIRVQDSGVGIPAGELPHIFTPFYRASTARCIPGTGIGLAGAKTIVEQHGGRITLESREGQGTTVTVYLPRRAQEQT
jgi:signal transduction histidine kinase